MCRHTDKGNCLWISSWYTEGLYVCSVLFAASFPHSMPITWRLEVGPIAMLSLHSTHGRMTWIRRWDEGTCIKLFRIPNGGSAAQMPVPCSLSQLRVILTRGRNLWEVNLPQNNALSTKIWAIYHWWYPCVFLLLCCSHSFTYNCCLSSRRGEMLAFDSPWTKKPGWSIRWKSTTIYVMRSCLSAPRRTRGRFSYWFV